MFQHKEEGKAGGIAIVAHKLSLYLSLHEKKKQKLTNFPVTGFCEWRYRDKTIRSVNLMS